MQLPLYLEDQMLNKHDLGQEYVIYENKTEWYNRVTQRKLKESEIALLKDNT